VTPLSNTGRALQLCLLAAVNYLLFYGLGIFLARTLGTVGFGRYNVGVATFTMLASLATLGLEKFSLRVFPSYIEEGNWNYARGFARFSSLIILAVSSLGAILWVAGNWWSYDVFRTYPVTAAVLLVAFITSMSLVMFLVEMLSAGGRAVLATLVYRLFLPVGVVGLIGAVALLGGGLTVRRALICYGASWVLSLALILEFVRHALPADIWKAAPKMRIESRQWLRSSAPFLAQSFMMTLFASSGVIILEMLRPGDAEIGIYAAAMQVSSFAVLMATATNRFYAPRGSVLLDRKDWDGIGRLKRERHAWVNPMVLLFLAVILLFGKKIMGLYGPEFTGGYPALCILALGIAVSVKYAMASLALQFFGKARWVLGATCVAGLLNVALLVALGGPFGATGAAIAYSLSLGGMSLAMYLKALYWVRRQQAAMPGTAGSGNSRS
jgi:O-antigen/teichoic acid export membrane protein